MVLEEQLWGLVGPPEEFVEVLKGWKHNTSLYRLLKDFYFVGTNAF